MESDYYTVTLSVDALEWTKHWLEGRRCDLLAVALAARKEIFPKVRIVAVESKARTEKNPLSIDADAEPCKGAIEQVVATLDALSSILCPEKSGDSIADIKQGAFIEHLVSEVLARLYPIEMSQLDKAHVLKVLTELSRRSLNCERDIALEGLVVVTQPEATVDTIRRVVSAAGEANVWPLRLVRCGIPELRHLFEETGALPPPKEGGPAHGDEGEPPPPVPGGDAGGTAGDEGGRRGSAEQGPGGERGVGETAGTDLTPQDRREEFTDSATTKSEGATIGEVEGSEISELIEQLEMACRLRGFPIDEIDKDLARIGPTLVSVPVSLEAGSSIGPIEAAANDIARELGVRAIAVENDPRPYHIRFLIPRRRRIFVKLPEGLSCAYSTESRHYLGLALGATVEGNPYQTFVSEWPHLLVAGTTGSGKTTLLRSVLVQLGQLGSGAVEIAIIDGKAEYDYVGMLDSDMFNSHFPDVLLGFENASPVLDWLVKEEIVRRRELLRDYFASNKDAPRQPREAYISALAKGESFPMKPLIVVIDEFAEIMQASGKSAKEFSDLVQRAVQTGRSALVHLLLATQRPGTAVISGEIKANLPSRIALALPSHHDSMTIIDRAGAEDLLGSGDMLFVPSSGGIVRLQAYNP